MKSMAIPLLLMACPMLSLATTITITPVHEPISLHGADNDDAAGESGEALQASVMPRPMALTGAFPETLVEAIRTPHAIPTNNPNYQVKETNLLQLCDIAIHAELTEEGLVVRLRCDNLNLPPEVDLTARQVVRLTLVAIRRTLEDYQKIQTNTLRVHVLVEAESEQKSYLKALSTTFQLTGGTPR